MKINRKWTTKYKDSLPNSHFLVPKYRALPYKDRQGNISLSHVRNALARADQVKGVPQADIARARRKAENILLDHGGYERDMQRNGRASEVDEQAATELVMYTENNSELWGPGNTQGASIRKNLKEKQKRGTLDPSRVPKLFEYLMDSSAKMYAKEYASPGEWNTIFTKATRRLAAQEMADEYLEELELQSNGSDEVERIRIDANRWRDSSGNTYHVAYVNVGTSDGKSEELVSEVTYGYGSQYERTAIKMLEEAGYVPTGSSKQGLWRLMDKLGIKYESSADDVRRKKDL